MAIPFSEAGADAASAIERRAWSRTADLMLLIALYFVVAAAAFSGFYEKWGFRDEDPKFSFAAMIDGTADKPYVYRQLLPALANGVVAVLPQTVAEALTEVLYRTDGQGALKSKITSPQAIDTRYALRYHVVYYATFFALIASLFVMRAMCLAAGNTPFVATAAPAIFALFVPILQSVGGYFYDFSEILFMATAFLLCFRGQFIWLVPLGAIATLNKESFFFFLLTLYPLIRASRPFKETLALIGLSAGLSLVTYVSLRFAYADNPGMPLHDHALESLLYYINPLNLLGRDVTYGVKTMQGYSIVTLALVAIIGVRGWPAIPVSVRRQIILAAAINLPLFLLFCFPGEIRNLSMLYMGGVLLLAAGMSEAVSRRRSEPADPY